MERAVAGCGLGLSMCANGSLSLATFFCVFRSFGSEFVAGSVFVVRFGSLSGQTG